MVRSVKVNIVGEVCGEPVTGLWCERCLTSARVAVPVMVTIDNGAPSLVVGSLCERCETPEQPNEASR